jgi:hypothetical protein
MTVDTRVTLSVGFFPQGDHDDIVVSQMEFCLEEEGGFCFCF